MKHLAIFGCAQETPTTQLASAGCKHVIAGNVSRSSRQAAISRSVRA